MESLAKCKKKYRKLRAFWERYQGLIKNIGYGMSKSESKCVDFLKDFVLTDEGVFLRTREPSGGYLHTPIPMTIAEAIRKFGSQERLIEAIRKFLIERIDRRIPELHEEISSLRDSRCYLDGSW